MSRSRLRFGVLLASLAALARSAGAAETAAFLNVRAGARALGMGEAYTALADDANALDWNPAGLSASEKSEVSVSHAELSQSVRHDFLAYARPTPQGTFAAGAAYLSQSALDGRDALGHPTGGFSASDAAVSFGFGRKTGPADVGASVKYVRSHIGSAEAQTFAVDAGARRSFGAVVLGVALRNIGPGMKYDVQRNDLPLRLAFGAAYKFAGGSGFEAARGLTLGLGVRGGRWGLDYAAVPMGELGATHRFTLGARF